MPRYKTVGTRSAPNLKYKRYPDGRLRCSIIVRFPLRSDSPNPQTGEFVDEGWFEQASGHWNEADAMRWALAQQLKEITRLNKIATGVAVFEAQAKDKGQGLEKPLQEYSRHLIEENGSTDETQTKMKKRVRDVLTAGKMDTVGSINYDRTIHALRTLSDERKWAARTWNAHRAAVQGFCLWLGPTYGLEINPCQRIPKKDEAKGRVYKRRAPTPGELSYILTMLEEEENRSKEEKEIHHAEHHDWIERSSMLILGFQCGLRASSVLRCKPEYFTHHDKGGHADGEWVEGRFPDFITKDNQNLIGAIVDPRCVKIFKRHLDRREPGQRLFPTVERTYPSKLMKKLVHNARAKWLKEAEKDARELKRRHADQFLMYKNHNNEHVGFHSLRRYVNTRNGAANVSSAITSMMTGHSSQAMIDLYTDNNIDAVKNAVLSHPRL